MAKDQDTETWLLSEDRFSISDEEGIHVYLFQYIIMCVADGNYTKIYIKGLAAPLIFSGSLKVWADALSKETFWQVHRSYIVNRDHIKHFLHADNGTLVLTGDLLAYVSEANHPKLKAALTKNKVSRVKPAEKKKV